MPEIKLEPLERNEYDRFSGWFHRDAADLIVDGPSDIAGMFSGLHRPLAWKIMSGDTVVGIIIIDVDAGGAGHLNLVIERAFRRQGFASAAVKRLVTLPEVRDLSGLAASVNASNTGGQKVLNKNGFSRTGTTSEGHQKFELR